MTFRTMLLIGLCVVLPVVAYFLWNLNALGKEPGGERRERIQKSPHFREGAFQNIEPTEMILKDASYTRMLIDFMNKPKNVQPSKPLPSRKTGLNTLVDTVPAIVWFGHSSYLIRYQGKSLLIDPVLSGYAAPVSFTGKAFPGTDIYTPEEFGEIDVVILTHDHYDHLDYESILKLKSQVKKFICPLGVGEHLEYWGVEAGKIVEKDWWEPVSLWDTDTLICTPARHFSGRKITRNQSLWCSWVLKLGGYSFFLGGDSGYDAQFRKIGTSYGPFDLVFLESGQYGNDWPYIHMTPEETVQAALDLQAAVLMPVHWGKFALAMHPWTEPIERLHAEAGRKSLKICTPMIGEAFFAGKNYPDQPWWRGLE